MLYLWTDYENIIKVISKLMNVEEEAHKLRGQIAAFLEHKDFSQEGNLVFKEHEKQILGFTKKPSCISVCLLILRFEAQPQVQYFASLLLKDKLKYDFDQLEQWQIVQAHQQIMQIIDAHPQPTQIFISNIALSLVYIYIHYYDKFEGILPFLDNNFSKLNTQHKYRYSFKVLEMVPEEIQSSRLVIDEQKREKVMNYLEQQQKQVLIYLHTVGGNIGSYGVAKGVVFEMFSNWIEAGYSEEAMSNLQQHSIIKIAFESINNTLQTEESSRCIIQSINLISPDYNSQTVMFMANSIFQMLERVHSFLDDDHQVAENYIRIFCEFGIKFSRLLIQQYNVNIHNYLLKMIEFFSSLELEIMDSLFQFWNSVLFEINECESKTITQEQAHFIVSKLFMVLCHRIRYSNEHIQQLNTITEAKLPEKSGGAEDLYQLRDESREIFEKIIDCLGQQRYVNQVMKAIKGLDPNSKDFLSTLESYLFCLRDALSQYPTINQDIVQLIQLFDQVGLSCEIIRKDFIRIFEQLFTIKDKNKEILNKLFHNILNMFSKSFLFDRAEKAFAKGCKQNPSLLLQNLDSLISLIGRYPNKQHILKGLMDVLKNQPVVLQNYFGHIWKIPFEIVKNSQNKKERINGLQSLFTIFDALPDDNIDALKPLITQMLEESWPTLKQIIQNPTVHYSEEDKLIEKSCKLLKRIMRKIKEDFLKYFESIFTVILNAFKQYPLSPYVYLLEVAITVYGEYNPQVINWLQILYVQFYDVTINHLQTIKNSFSQLQYLIDDFIGLHIRIFVYNAGIILNTGKVQGVLRFNLECLVSNQPKLTSSASHLFQDIFMIYWTPYSREKYKKEAYGEVVVLKPQNMQLYGELRKLLRPMVPEMIFKLLKALEQSPPEFVRENIIDCLIGTILAFPTENIEIWEEPLKLVNEDILTQVQKKKLKEYFAKLMSNDMEQFDKAEIKLHKLLYTMTKRYMHRKNRENISKQLN